MGVAWAINSDQQDIISFLVVFSILRSVSFYFCLEFLYSFFSSCYCFYLLSPHPHPFIFPAPNLTRSMSERSAFSFSLRPLLPVPEYLLQATASQAQAQAQASPAPNRKLGPGDCLEEQLRIFLESFKTLMALSRNSSLWYILVHSTKGHLALLHPEHFFRYLCLLLLEDAGVDAFAFYLVPRVESTQMFFTYPLTDGMQRRPHPEKILNFTLPLYGFFFRKEDVAGIYSWKVFDQFQVYSDLHFELNFGDPCPYMTTKNLMEGAREQFRETLLSFVPKEHLLEENQPFVFEGYGRPRHSSIRRVAYLVIVTDHPDCNLCMKDSEGQVKVSCRGKGLLDLAFSILDSLSLRQPHHPKLPRKLNKSISVTLEKRE